MAATAAGDAHHFSADALLRYFTTCAELKHDIPIADFVAGCLEIRKIVYSMGSGFAIASSDIHEKGEIMTHRLRDLEKEAGAAGLAPPLREGEAGDGRVRGTIQYLVQHEMEKKVERMNSSKYVSGARSTLRLMWFLDFLCTFITRLLEDKEELRDSASAAYDEALAPHHPWLVRKTVHGAMYFVPHKATFWHNLAGTDDRSVIAPVMAAALEKMQILRQQLWAYYGEHKLTDLP